MGPQALTIRAADAPADTIDTTVTPNLLSCGRNKRESISYIWLVMGWYRRSMGQGKASSLIAPHRHHHVSYRLSHAIDGWWWFLTTEPDSRDFRHFDGQDFVSSLLHHSHQCPFLPQPWNGGGKRITAKVVNEETVTTKLLLLSYYYCHYDYAKDPPSSWSSSSILMPVVGKVVSSPSFPADHGVGPTKSPPTLLLHLYCTPRHWPE